MNSETANAAQAQAESAFGQLGFSLISELLPAVIAATAPGDTSPAQATTRRERRERERASAANATTTAPAVAPPVFEPVPVSTTQAAAPVEVSRPVASPVLQLDTASTTAVPTTTVSTITVATITVPVITVPASIAAHPVTSVEPTTRRAARTVADEPRIRRSRVATGRTDRVRHIPGATVRKRIRRPFKRALLSKLMSVGAMVGAAAMMVATTVPANAFYSVDTTTHSPLAVVAPVQTLSVPTDANTAAVGRDAYTVTSLAAQIRTQFGSRSFSYTNDPTGAIQWPFIIAVPISSGFGGRSAPCNGCSSFHEGVDFVPGAGAPIQAIADGVVSSVVVSDAGYGNHVVVDHVINGQKVQSLYAHMKYGSIRVAEGQQIKVTDVIGLVGSSGESTGPHLHFEIHLNGVPVDPFAWLKANAN